MSYWSLASVYDAHRANSVCLIMASILFQLDFFETRRAALSFPLGDSRSTSFISPSRMFSYLTYFLIIGIRWEDGKRGYWLAACGLASELKPPNVQRFEVSHLLTLIARSYSAERPFTPARMRRKKWEWNANCYKPVVNV